MSTQQRILQFLHSYSETFGWMPTYREIAEACDLSSTSVVEYHLSQLYEAGKIDRALGKARAIRVIEL